MYLSNFFKCRVDSNLQHPKVQIILNRPICHSLPPCCPGIYPNPTLHYLVSPVCYIIIQTPPCPFCQISLSSMPNTGPATPFLSHPIPNHQTTKSHKMSSMSPSRPLVLGFRRVLDNEPREGAEGPQQGGDAQQRLLVVPALLGHPLREDQDQRSKGVTESVPEASHC